MSQMNLVQALRSGLSDAMRQDADVMLLGEDIGKLGGVFRVTQGLQEEFGPDRVLDTPLSETGIVGTAIGMALHGLRPVSEIQFADFIYPGFDQLVSEAAKYRYRTAGEFQVPLVVRAPYGGGIRGGQYHSQSPEALFIHTPGLKVVCPSNPYDAKGLLMQAIQDDDPVVFFEPKRVYRAVKMDVPDTAYTVPLGEAKVVRTGAHVTCVAWGAMLYEAYSAAEAVAEQGVDVEVVDLRTLWPLDIDTLATSVRKTGRFVVVHEAPRTCGFGSELVALVTERAFLHLEAPPIRVTGWDTPFPLTHEREYLPLKHRIVPALLDVARY
ncbi:MAG: alpha-ketoacid dehydrogenase subunit beta [Myxococcales bacterium]|jgi:2-oxoisovalerate dehydrogenase E1 component beta subunit